jgi:hypothetical protein
MFEVAERLHGIYKTNDVTKSVTIDPRAFRLGAAPAAQQETQPPPAQPQHAAILEAEGVPATTPLVSKKARPAVSDKGKEEADEEESSSLREITNN